LPQTTVHQLWDAARLPWQELNQLDVEDQHCVFGDAADLFVAIAKVGAGLELAGSSRTHSFETIPEAGDDVTVPHNPNLLLVFGQEFATSELDVVSEPHVIAFL